jgi:uncharacterized protein YxjI
MATDGFGFDRYLVEQLFRPIVNLYRVTPLAAGETPAGGPVAFVRQKRMKIKEDIRFFADEEETRELFRIQARSILDTGGSRYDVTTADGEPIGVLHHRFKESLLRSTWSVHAPDDTEVARARERSLPFAILRRAKELSDVTDMIPIPYNFDLLVDGQVIGHLNRKFQIRDRYILDLAGDHERRVDRRLGIALAIGLDTLQNR